MVNNGLIEDRLNQIRISVSRLKKLADKSQLEFVEDPDDFAITEHHLRRALEALFDIGRHILAKEALGKPESYQQVIQALGSNRILPIEFAERISGMAGYRNRLTHSYTDVRPEELWAILQTRLDDFEQFYNHIHDMIH